MIEAELDRLHKEACMAINNLTLMITRRKVSKTALINAAEGLSVVSQDIHRFIERLK